MPTSDSVGDLLSGLLSQLFKSRKKIVMAYLLGTIALVAIFLYTKSMTASYFLFNVLSVGMCLLDIGHCLSRLLRAVWYQYQSYGNYNCSQLCKRCSRSDYTWIYEISMGSVNSAVVVGIICIGLAIVATLSIRETFF